jgi:cytochrome c peroxidase
MYQKIGLVKPYKTNDKGRFTITKKKRDTHKFKVPILRNITKTGPYFHDGSVKTLEKAITLMAEHQVGKSLTKNELSDLMAFMDSLEAKKLDYTSEN